MTTTGWKTGNSHQIEIWFVEEEKKYYIMSEGQEKAHWVRNISHNPEVSFRIGDQTFKGTARIVDRQKEPQLASKVAFLMSTKYGWDHGLIVELAPRRQV